MKNKSGFTLVEIAVVITVIAILAAITIVAYGSIQKQSRDEKRKADMVLLAGELKKYYDKKGEYPLACTLMGGSTGSDCPSRVSAYTSSVGVAPSATIDTTTTRTQLKTIFPGLGDSFGDPLSTADTPFNQKNSGSSYLSTKGYIILSLNMYNMGDTMYLGTNPSVPGIGMMCGFSAVSYDEAGTYRANYPHYYVLGYFSEVENKWKFLRGPFATSTTNTRWNAGANTNCDITTLL